MSVRRTGWSLLVRCCALAVVCAGGGVLLAQQPLRAEPSDAQFISALEAWSESAVVPHQATRHLETRKIGADERAWIDVTTTVDPRRGFAYHVDGQGGPNRLRRRMLDLLKEEERAWATRDPLRSAFSTRNYTLSLTDSRQAEVDVRLVPKRRETYLLDGRVTLRRLNGEVLRVQGSLAKTPSFWLRDVTLVRNYERIGDHIMLSSLQSIARVRWWGNYQFSMVYTYRVIDGVPVAQNEAAASRQAARQDMKTTD